MPVFKSLEGQTFGFWTVKELQLQRTKRMMTQYRCVCVCGNERIIPRANLATGKSIERDNNNGNYTKDNCRWATRYEQAQNRRPR